MSYPWAHLIDSAWERFLRYLDTSRGPDGCWPWIGGTSCGKGNTAPYGSFAVGGGWSVRAHIFACVAAGHPHAPSRDHFACGNTLCCNPAHIEGVSARENSLRRWRACPTWRKAA